MFLKYFDQGFYTIPIRPSSKATALPPGYSLIEWANDGISEELITQWDAQYPIEKGYGIALVCGKASNVIAVDIDTDDPRVLDLIPESPCEKVGARPTRFFRYSEDFAEKKNIGKNTPGLKDHVEILTSGQYCILPPSIHPQTKKGYFWTTDDNLLWLTPDDLPLLPLETLDALESYYAKKYGEVVTGTPAALTVDLTKVYVADPKERDRQCPTGSHNRLKQLAATMIREEKPIGDAIRALYDYDLEHHRPVGYFSDKTRGADAKFDPKTNAARFYTNILASVNRQREIRGEVPHDFMGEELEIVLTPADRPPGHILLPYPRARGLMGHIQTYAAALAPFNQDAVSLGGAVALMSILCANKFRTQIGHFDVRPNLYVLNLAKSGVGKEAMQSLLIDLLSNSRLLGSGGYKSGTSIVQGLPSQQERLNIIDEAAAWLKSIGEGEGFQQEMNDVLSGLFTRVSGFFPGISLARDKADRLGACWNPSLTILASTTLHGFKGAVTQAMGAKGLMPRFLTFWQHSLGKYKTPRRQDVVRALEAKKKLQLAVNQYLKLEKRVHADFNLSAGVTVDLDGETESVGKRYDPEVVPITDDAEVRYFEYARSKAPEDTLFDSFDEPFLNRHAELAGKLALLDTVSRGEAEITLESLEWAIAVVETQWHNVQNLFKETSAENHTEKTSMRVIEIIRAEGGIISRPDLSRKTQWLKKAERAAVLESLEESRQIEKVVVDSDHTTPSGKKAKPEVSYRLMPRA